ncbi:uncharacterized protein [Oryza sativa Japonica Group]|jgi:hypothetical protein|uniref:Expressed protein n=2 Tax=Oryza sativa subsp. japonica TaxID=39947 RepID=Q8S5H8_ORYSJ|nr:uncharacterized protein LOC4348192 [Oryza sativa Japonica Group]AAM08847.1 Hypothetical protein [Oryza sativa Japonica Group]AAP52360.1 expressed protein [Oryza sativa Japonica Group]EAZ15443.1 hypothetical protein OsJ_30858 [Oryza sativa Japonica Group]KAF2912773.1 hypothetical protein DAI22_10g038000 [Oryza sativa Japonica Group]BAF26153.1 Os10g0173000 [Oryza sativa Japonica Group]|eukprot:NP_001064239.1 Os10g0173000 [Oryza sativa Japonica Group]
MDESSDLQWRQGWLAVGLPPAPVVAVSAIVGFFLYLTWQMDEYEEQLRRRTQAGLWVLLVLGAVALVLLGSHALVDAGGRVAVPVSWRWGGGYGGSSGDDGGGASPWAVAAVVAVLLVLASHKPSFQMFRPPWHYK